MSNRRIGDDPPVRAIDRILAFTALALIVVSILSFIAIIIGTAAGADFSAGVWPVVGVLVYVTPIIGFGALLTLLIMSMVRRGRTGG